MTLTRKHHPLEGKRFGVVSGGPTQIVVRLADGSSMRVPRSWTDADGPPPDVSERVFTIDALRELVALVEALQRRI